jgi:hypothetical protein
MVVELSRRALAKYHQLMQALKEGRLENNSPSSMVTPLEILPPCGSFQNEESGASAGEPQLFRNNSFGKQCFSTPMGRRRLNTTQVGWRYPVHIIEAVRTEARRQGIREGKLVEQILRRHLTGRTEITTAAELMQRLPAEVEMKRSAESNLAKTLHEFES